MKIEIFDVEHGQCVLVTADSGDYMLIDCGHNATTGWRPSTMLADRSISHLNSFSISNCDEDHVSDLVGVANRLLKPDGGVSISYLSHNFDITPTVVRAMKAPNPLTPNMDVLCAILPTYNTTPTLLGGSQAFGLNVCRRFKNRYPGHFADPTARGFSNNLSVVTFLHYGDIHVVFPGDLEPDGWRRLLTDAGFLQQLATVNVFVAPHHGRDTGYLADVFNHCSPKIVVISDGNVQYDTQTGVYGVAQASGILMSPHGTRLSLLGSEDRYVLTTRRDTTPDFPHIVIQQQPGQSATVWTASKWGCL